MDIKTHLTAIKRSKISMPCRELLEKGYIRQDMSVLDYGCGYGKDVESLRSFNIDADGYDSYCGFGWNNVPSRKYDFVMLNYVINVIPTERERNDALNLATSLRKIGGKMSIATRSDIEINDLAKKNKWEYYQSYKYDGWITGSNTFQRGYSPSMLYKMMCGCVREDKWKMNTLINNKSCTLVVFDYGKNSR